MPTSRSYESYLIESLQDPEEAAAYLASVLEDGNEEEVLLALQDVVEARLATGNVEREKIQQILSSPTHLDMMTLLKIVSELGFKLSVIPRENVA